MRVRVWSGAVVVAAALVPVGPVSAQTADTVELPAVVVTTASPVAKPAKAKAKSVFSDQQAPADEASARPPHLLQIRAAARRHRRNRGHFRARDGDDAA